MQNPKRDFHSYLMGYLWWSFPQETLSETNTWNLNPLVRQQAYPPLSSPGDLFIVSGSRQLNKNVSHLLM